MESLTIAQRKVSREEVLTGFGGAVLVHAVVLVLALVGPWIMPHHTFKGSVYTVNLVSLQDIGSPAAAPKKGVKEGSAAESNASAQNKPSSRAKSSPVVPVKRLQMDDAAPRINTDIKKLDAPDIPKISEKAPANAASVEKDLEKLLPKPKVVAKPAPIIQDPPHKEETPRRGSSADQPKVASAGGTAGDKPASRTSAGGSEPAAKGVPEGSSKGSLDGTAAGGSSQGSGKGTPGASNTGSPDGGRVATALLGMYGDKIRGLINQYWSVPDSLKANGLEVRLKAVVSRDGRVEALQIEKSSGNSVFDECAVRAVRKAAPLPPLPQLYSYPNVELGLRFRPEGLS